MPRALIVHTGGGLGDVLLSRPVIDTLVAAGFETHFLARESTAVAVENHPKLSQLLTIPSKDPANFSQMREWANKLRENEYQVCLLLWCTSKWAWTLALSGIPQRVGQDSRLLSSFLFTHKVKIRSEHGDEESHWTQILLDYPKALSLPEPESVEVRFPVSSAQERQARERLGAFDFGGRNGPLIGFHSGKGLDLDRERWPVAEFGRLAHGLQTQLDARLVLTGGPGEVDIVDAVSESLESPALNLAGKTKLQELAAVCRECDLFVCPDSGPMHLAAAVQTPIVGIYALDEDFPKRWAPFGVNHRIVRPERPACHPGCTKPKCPDFICYRKVTTESVLEAARSLLKGSGPGIGQG